MGLSTMTWASVQSSFSSAAEYTTGLKLLPGWRQAWNARLYSLASKSYPPTIAERYCRWGSMETSAPCSSGSCSSR